MRKVGLDPVEQMRIPEQLERGRPLGLTHGRYGRLWRQGPLDLGLLQSFQRQQHAPQLAAQDVLRHAELDAGLLEEPRPLARRVQVEGVHVEAAGPRPGRPRDQHVHLQERVAQIRAEAPYAVAAVPVVEDDLLAMDLGGSLVARLGSHE